MLGTVKVSNVDGLLMTRFLAAGATALTLALGATLVPSTASATVTLAAGEEGCDLFSAQGCLFDWSGGGGGGGDFDDPALIVAAYNAVHNATPAPEDLPTLTFLGKSGEGSSTSMTFTDLPFEVSFYAVKSATQFILFGLDTPTDSFTAYNTRIANKKGKLQDISHVTFFGAPSTPPGGVPEPAAWALMIFGFGAAGAALRASRRLKAA
jgi:hypothetical protein